MNRKKLTQEEFEKRVYARTNGEYSVTSKYKNARSKVTIRHNKCGYESDFRIDQFYNSKGCKLCSGKILNTEKYEERIESRFGDEFTLLDEYVNSTTKIRFKHNVCGYEFMRTPNGFDSKKGCPKCNKRMRYTDDTYKAQLKELSNNEMIVLEEYKSAKIPIIHKHLICGYKWNVSPTSIRSGKGCPYCYGNIRLEHEEYVDIVKELVGNEYNVLGEYESRQTHLLMRHETCGTEWNITPAKFRNGRRCPNCKSSGGERAIEEYLQINGYKYKSEYTFSDLKHIVRLRFDFAVFNNNKVITLIEFDGPHHFSPIDFFGGEKHYEGTIYRDKLKNDYCYRNGIPLIRIPYYNEEYIESILDHELDNIYKKNGINAEQISLFT
ncbi:hypothetical protein [Oceanobacillus sp. CF4.6]|uniref:hypothetical protein n=1 Tax=Oceanobacillus sp. CF4.6 TaxID=3373080 RepID=UPI003EE531DA